MHREEAIYVYPNKEVKTCCKSFYLDIYFCTVYFTNLKVSAKNLTLLKKALISRNIEICEINCAKIYV